VSAHISAAVRRAAGVGSICAGLVIGTSGQALASGGCDSVNAGGFTAFANETTPPISSGSDITIANFAVGDTITFTIRIVPGTGNPRWSLGAGSNDSNIASAVASATRSYTITGNPIGSEKGFTFVSPISAGAAALSLGALLFMPLRDQETPPSAHEKDQLCAFVERH
jgi:hypothetical protein